MIQLPLTMYILIIASLLIVSAQSIPPNTTTGIATKEIRTSKLSSDHEADKASQAEPEKIPGTPQAKTGEEQAKAESLSLLTRRYMWATIVGVVGAWIGIAVLVIQTMLSRKTSERQSVV